MNCKEKEIVMILDENVLKRYNEYYFAKYPKRKAIPIEQPYHPSINVWCIMPRMKMNGVKQRWKDFIVWWVNDLGYQDLHLDNFEMYQKIYFKTKRRHDIDNYVGKFIHDGFSESGFIVDDDEKHFHKITMELGYDKDNPRTEFIFKILG